MSMLRTATDTIDRINTLLNADTDTDTDDVATQRSFPVWSRPSQGSAILTFANSDGEAECAGCPFVADGRGSYLSEKVNEFTTHITRHRTAGHAVPQGLEHTVRRDWRAAFGTGATWPTGGALQVA